MKEAKEISKTKKLNKKNYFGLSISQEAASKDKVHEDITKLMDGENINIANSPHLGLFSTKTEGKSHSEYNDSKDIIFFLPNVVTNGNEKI